MASGAAGGLACRGPARGTLGRPLLLDVSKDEADAMAPGGREEAECGGDLLGPAAGARVGL